MIIAFAGQKGGVGKTTSAVCVACELDVRGRRVLLVDGDPQGTATTWAAVAHERGRGGPSVVSMGATMHRGDQLPRVARAFDDVVIDCPPRHDAVQRAALMSSDLAVLPCGPSPADVWSLAGSAALIGEAQIVRPALRGAVLLTRRQAGTALARGARDVLAEAGLPILRAVLGLRVVYAEALAAGQGVTTYAPGDVATLEVRRLVDELEAMSGEVRHVA